LRDASRQIAQHPLQIIRIGIGEPSFDARMRVAPRRNSARAENAQRG
jgi:hypothetical protein